MAVIEVTLGDGVYLRGFHKSFGQVRHYFQTASNTASIDIV